MFESCWAHHSTHGERAARRRRAASESKGQSTSSIHFHSPTDDGIVVRLWFVYMLRCSNGSLYVGETKTSRSELRTITGVAGRRIRRSIVRSNWHILNSIHIVPTVCNANDSSNVGHEQRRMP